MAQRSRAFLAAASAAIKQYDWWSAACAYLYAAEYERKDEVRLGHLESAIKYARWTQDTRLQDHVTAMVRLEKALRDAPGVLVADPPLKALARVLRLTRPDEHMFREPYISQQIQLAAGYLKITDTQRPWNAANASSQYFKAAIHATEKLNDLFLAKWLNLSGIAVHVYLGRRYEDISKYKEAQTEYAKACAHADGKGFEVLCNDLHAKMAMLRIHAAVRD